MTHVPQLIAFVGPMFSAKTTGMLACLEKFKYQNRHIVAFKPKIDDRYSESKIVSHMGWELPATQISDGKCIIIELLSYFSEGVVPNNVVVAVDELFMIPGISSELLWLYKNDITVVVSTLDLSYNCTPFDEVTRILPYATTVKKCVAVCSVCKADAHYTWRKPIDNDSEIVVGGVELYEPRCKNCHPNMQNGEVK